MPIKVSEQFCEEYIEVEEIFLQEEERQIYAKKFARIVVKLHCYHRFEVSCDKWYEELSIKKLAELIKAVVMSNDGFLNLLCAKDNMLIQVEDATLHISIYNPPLHAVVSLSSLVTAEGLFLRRAEI